MSSPRFRPLGVEPIEDRILPSGFGFHDAPHQSWGGRDSWSSGGTFDSRTFDGGVHHALPPDGFSRDAPGSGPTGDFGRPPPPVSPPPPSGGPGFPSGPVVSGPTAGGTGAQTPPGGTTAGVSSPSSPAAPNPPARDEPAPAATVSAQNPSRGTPGFLAPDSAGRILFPAATVRAAEAGNPPGGDPVAAAPGHAGVADVVPEVAPGSPPPSDAAEPAGLSRAVVAAVSNLSVGITFADAAPIVVDLPGGSAVAGLLGLDAAALEDGVRGVLDRVAAVVCEPPEGEGRDWEAWLATAAVLSGWAGYALWSNRKARRAAQLASGSGSVTVRPGGHA